MRTEFPVPLPIEVVQSGLIILSALLIFGSVLVLISVRSRRQTTKPIGRARFWTTMIIAIILIATSLPLTFLLFTFTASSYVALSEDGIEVNSPPGFANKLLSRNDIVRAFVVDLSSDQSFRPVIRTFGLALGSYKSGWFALGNGAKALFLAASDRVLVVETRQDFFLILSPPNFEAFIRAFRENLGVEVAQ